MIFHFLIFFFFSYTVTKRFNKKHRSDPKLRNTAAGPHRTTLASPSERTQFLRQHQATRGAQSRFAHSCGTGGTASSGLAGLTRGERQEPRARRPGRARLTRPSPSAQAGRPRPGPAPPTAASTTRGRRPRSARRAAASARGPGPALRRGSGHGLGSGPAITEACGRPGPHLKSLSLDVIFSSRLEMWYEALAMLTPAACGRRRRREGGEGGVLPAWPAPLRPPLGTARG